MNANLPIFVDDEYYEPKKGYYRLSDLDSNKYEVMVCVGDSKLRKKLVEKLPTNTRFFSYIHPTALILGEDVEIGEGSFIGAYSILTTNIKVGKHCLMNRSCHIGHDCMIGNYLSMMPGSIISGNVTIGDNFYLGTNSSIREKLNICDDVVVGLNSGVIHDIQESGVYVGTPSVKKKDLN